MRPIELCACIGSAGCLYVTVRGMSLRISGVSEGYREWEAHFVQACVDSRLMDRSEFEDFGSRIPTCAITTMSVSLKTRAFCGGTFPA